MKDRFGNPVRVGDTILKLWGGTSPGVAVALVTEVNDSNIKYATYRKDDGVGWVRTSKKDNLARSGKLLINLGYCLDEHPTGDFMIGDWFVK